MHRIAPPHNPQQGGLFSGPLPPLPPAFLGTTTKSSSARANAGFAADYALTFAPASALLAFRENLTYPATPQGKHLERYALQSAARSIIPDSRTASCLRSVRPDATSVPVRLSPSTKRARYANLQVCGSVWRCPVCAAKISDQRRRELLHIMDAHKAAGGRIYLLTLTFPHSDRDRLADLLKSLKKAEEQFKSGRAWAAIQRDFGLIGTARAVECTFGKNGWHPHAHHLVFTTGSIDTDAFKNVVFDKWHKACTISGLGSPTLEHGIDVRDGAKAADYVAKFGLEDTPKVKEWGLENELTKWHSKKGRGSSVTPFDFLRIALQSDDAKITAQARSKFKEYAEAFHGKRQLVISPKLKKLYPIEEKSDDEAAGDIREDDITLARFTLTGWREILRLNLRGEVLLVAQDGDAEKLHRYVMDRAGVSHTFDSIFMEVRQELDEEAIRALIDE